MSLHGEEEGGQQLPSPIQRILVIHLNLYERCMKGKSLSEGASLEELSEQILYYHRDRRIHHGGASNADTSREKNSAEKLMQEAVQFLGLCTALYSLPTTLSPLSKEADPNMIEGREEDDKTQAIYFGKSTLVFIPLESSVDIVAVVQVGRSSKGEYASNTGSGNPLAIRASIERSHRLFCMLNGGGILHRLNGDPSSTPYDGMDELFRLLKELRKAKDRLLRLDTTSEQYYEINAQTKGILEDIRSLRQRLTIQSVRRDLDSHYKEYLSEFSLAASRNGGAGRCMVEVSPQPIAKSSGSHTLQLPPSFASPHSIESLRKAVQQSVNKHVPSDDNDSGVSAISTFHEGQFLHCVTSPKSAVLFPSDSVNLLMAYMASYKAKMTHIAGRRQFACDAPESSRPSSAPPSGIRLFTRSIGSMAGSLTKDDVSFENPNDGSSQQQVDWNRRGLFLPTPPSFMLSASHQTHSIKLGDQSQKNVWAPLVHLPTKNSKAESSINLGRSGVHAVMFEFLQFNFLIFMSNPSQAIGSIDKSRLLLMELEQELSEAVLGAVNDDGVDGLTSNSVMEWTNSPGQDMILLERSKQCMILLQDPLNSSARRDSRYRMSTKKPPQPLRFLGFGPRKKKESTPLGLSQSAGSLALEWSALGLDCRHLLASRLPLDVSLAFDDMINEVTKRKDHHLDEPLEICTCMSYGWVYAYAKGDKEIYVFFDNSIYVTVADVQSAAMRIRETFTAT